jgi:hypothetical protein
MYNADDMSQAIQWSGGFAPVNGATNQQFQFPKNLNGSPLGSGLTAWATDGTSTPINSGDIVAWYYPGSNQVYDCAWGACSLQPLPFPGGSEFLQNKNLLATRSSIMLLYA